jgi:hypothetical protein
MKPLRDPSADPPLCPWCALAALLALLTAHGPPPRQDAPSADGAPAPVSPP